MLGSASAWALTIKLFGREIIFKEFQPMWSRYLNSRTDRQTDRQTSCHLITALCVAYRAVNTKGGPWNAVYCIAYESKLTGHAAISRYILVGDRSVFIQIFLVISVKRFFSARVRFGRSRSSKVINFGSLYQSKLSVYTSIVRQNGVIVNLIVLSCTVSDILQVFVLMSESAPIPP